MKQVSRKLHDEIGRGFVALTSDNAVIHETTAFALATANP
jgi:hypothetical protein